MVGGILKIKVDENEVDKLSKVKKYGVTTAAEPTRRAALGDLQNRVLRTVTGKQATEKDPVKENNHLSILRNAKARVDTRLRKSGSTTSTKNVVAKENNNGSAGSVASLGQRKIVTRSNSVRTKTTIKTASTTTTNGSNGAGGLQRNGSVMANQRTKTTVTTKIVENKVHQVKYVNKTKTQDKAAANIDPTLRREDSNLSRKSLTKIKAALTREANKAATGVAVKTTATTAGPVLVIKKKVTTSEEKIFQNTHAHKVDGLEKLRLSPLLNGVEDIDAGDGENLMLVSQYAKDIYDYLYTLEEEHAIRKNHLDGQLEVQAKMRAVLVDWINEVHLQFHLAPETYQMAVAIIDRYLQTVKDTKRSYLQLVGVTALFIAAKYEELFPPSISDFVYITDDTYTARQILQMELKIFKALDCNLSRPLPIHFLRRFSKAAKAEDAHHTMSKYFLELVSIEYDMASYKPSEVAAASLFLSLQLLKNDATIASDFDDKQWNTTLQFYSRYTPDHLRPIVKKLAAIVRNAPNAKLKAVHTKYQSSSFHKIAQRQELYGALIDSIINSEV